MPACKKGDLILVTGASGFVGSHTSQAFLKHGFRVRATVRSREKGEYLRNLFEGQGGFEYAVVPDVVHEGAFDDAVKGVDGVAHTAAPFHLKADRPEEIMDPSIKGTEGILRSIEKHNPDCKRILLTSSYGTIVSPVSNTSPHVYTEADWNKDSLRIVEEEGRDAPPIHKYRAGKILAEKAFWKYIEEEKPAWDGATICPPTILGPVIHECDAPENLNESVRAFYQWAAGNKTEADLRPGHSIWVSVLTVAEAHVQCILQEKAAGERWGTSFGKFAFQDWCDVLNQHYPDLKNIPVGQPGTHDELCRNSDNFVGEKIAKELGVQNQGLEDCIVQMTQSLRTRFNF